MKSLKYLAVVVLAALIMLPVLSPCAPALSPTPTPRPTVTPSKGPLPQVPITYPGDTYQTIVRRAQWVEGAKKEGRLVWYGSSAMPLGQQIIAKFNKAFPFIRVDYWAGGKGDEVAAKVEAEFISGHYGVDVVQIGEQLVLPRWRKMGMIQKFTDIIPGGLIEKLSRGTYGRYGDWVVPGNNAVAPQYNTKLVSASEAPKSWEDLLDPKWKGQMGHHESYEHWSMLALGAWGLEKTDEFLAKLKGQSIIWQRSAPGAHSLLKAGEFKILVSGYLPHVFNSQKTGAPVNWSRVSPIPLKGLTFQLETKAPHPNAAKLFLEWLFSPQGLIEYEKATGYGAVYPGSPTRMAKALEGLDVVTRTEEMTLESIKLGLEERFAEILGGVPGAAR